MDRNPLWGLVSDALWVMEGDVSDLAEGLHEALDRCQRELTERDVIAIHKALRATVEELRARVRYLEEDLAEEHDAENERTLRMARSVLERVEVLVDPEIPAPPASTPAPAVPHPTAARTPAVPVSAASVAAPVPAAPAAAKPFVPLPDPPGGYGPQPAERESRPERLTFVVGSDWEGVYLDGRLIAEGHRVDGRDLAEALGMSVEYADEPSEEYSFQKGRLPALLEDLPGTR